MKSLTAFVVLLLVGLTVVASLAPSLIALSDALVPLIVVLGAVVVALRLVYFHTRKW